MNTPELPPLPGTALIFLNGKPGRVMDADMVERAVEARERILLARIAEVEAQRDYLVEEYERAIRCGKQGYLHCALHLFNAITNAHIEAAFAAKEKKE